MYRDLLLALTGTAGDRQALDAAVALAGALPARLSVLVTVTTPLPLATEWGGFPSELYADMHDQALQAGTALAERVRRRIASLPDAEVRLEDVEVLRAGRVAAVHAMHADLVLVAGSVADETRHQVEAMFLDLLRGSGRPVLMVPGASTAPLPPRTAVVAWKPSPEAARALHDALPLLARAQRVQVVVVDPQPGVFGHGQSPGRDACAHLARHGVAAEVVELPRGGMTVAGALLRHAREVGAELLVAGAYSHARMREQLLGGVTRELLASATLPVLFAH